MRCQGLIGLVLFSFIRLVAAEEAAVRVIVKYKQPLAVSSLRTVLSQTAHYPIYSLTPIAGGAYTLVFNDKNLPKSGLKKIDSTARILEQLRKNPNIVYAVKDRVGHFKPDPHPQTVLSMPMLSHELQWDEFSPPAGMMLESAPGRRDGAWAYSTGLARNPVIVAVLDTGITLNDSLINNLVKDAAGNIWGWNFAANNNNVIDETGTYHGTHVAGIIAGYGDVMVGVGENLKILPVKIPDARGMFYESQVINAIYWSVGGRVPGAPDNPYPAKVLNMSFGVDERPGKEIDHCDAALQDALLFVRQQGAVITAAAGNDNRWEHYNAPAACNGTMKIAATGPEGLRAYYSNYGPSVSFSAPGGDLRYGREGGILSTVNPGGGYQGTGFDFYQGSSMASPHAAGVAGLIFAIREGEILPEQVEQILYATTHDFGKSNDSNKSCVGEKPCGHGILDAEKAVKATLANFDRIITVPTANGLTLSSCGRSTYRPAVTILNTGTKKEPTEWLQMTTACQQKNEYSRIQLRQTNGDEIIVNYGAVSYRLNNSGFRRCQLIGKQGVGCYR
ncbi:S8 family serine peptidase [Legionella feeleii]|uniref:AprE, Subtilisin-like serine protease n=1 Tax=Legionella feeleii TaxID=453 RepID=A0A378IXI7_9GAMM|nr:S8 family serine peptidase [Legionella feeleii]STX39211.1 AprE, Subtilisin-like serine protease [Legionella feeleii]